MVERRARSLVNATKAKSRRRHIAGVLGSVHSGRTPIPSHEEGISLPVYAPFEPHHCRAGQDPSPALMTTHLSAAPTKQGLFSRTRVGVRADSIVRRLAASSEHGSPRVLCRCG